MYLPSLYTGPLFLQVQYFNYLECTYRPFSWGAGVSQELRLQLLTVKIQIQLCHQITLQPGTSPRCPQGFLPCRRLQSRENTSAKDSKVLGICQLRALINCCFSTASLGFSHHLGLELLPTPDPPSIPFCQLIPLFFPNTQLRCYLLLEAFPEILKQFSFIDSPPLDS